MSILTTGSFASPDTPLFVSSGSPASFSSVSTGTLFVSSINNAAYPPTVPITTPSYVIGNYSSFTAYTFDGTVPVTGCLSTSKILATYISPNAGVANNIQIIRPGTNSFYIKFAEQIPPNVNLNYGVFY